VKDALAKVVIFRTNSHDGAAGEALADTYDAHGLPHFILMDSSGAALDRWSGFRRAGEWLGKFNAAIADPTTTEAKEARYEKAPAEPLAAALGRIYGSLRDTKGAVGWYREAERLAGGPRPEYAAEIFFLQVRGSATGEFTDADVRASADRVTADPASDPLDKVIVALSMAGIATDKKDPSFFMPYEEPALRASEMLKGGSAAALRSELEIAGALLVKGDQALAVALKKKSMAPGWEENAGELNSFTWWCFESRVNLEEAEALARKGAGLAKPGAERAELLDTAAEICNSRGNAAGALALAEQAAKEDPKQEHYASQVKRFAGIRDGKKDAAGS
jgi:tetratricopeptide (TPR) repeat protein